MDDVGYRNLIDFIKTNISIDGSLYKQRPFKRRLKLRMKRTDTKSFNEYLTFLKTHKEELNILKDTLTINVTRFFRNKMSFDYIREYIKNDLLKRQSSINILSVGCSSGEEPYSIAIILENFLRTHNFTYKIIAVDVDKNMLSKAEIGSYTKFSLIELNENEKKRYFNKVNDFFIIKEQYKKNVEFKIIDIKNQSLLKRLGHFDIIMCRNVLIYFSREFQEKIFTTFHSMLSKNGVLILGKIEILMGDIRNKYLVINKKERVYRKIDN